MTTVLPTRDGWQQKDQKRVIGGCWFEQEQTVAYEVEVRGNGLDEEELH